MLRLPRRLRSLAASTASLVAGCGGGGGTVVLSFEHLMQQEPLVPGTPLLTRYGQVITFDELRYLVNEPVLHLSDTKLGVPLPTVVMEPGHDDIVITGVPAGSFTGLSFHIGADIGTNSGLWPPEGELAEAVGLEHKMGGFSFLSASGAFEEQGSSGRFAFRVGTNPLYKRLTAVLEEPVELADGETLRFDVTAEVDRLFAGVELSERSSWIGGAIDSPAANLASNYGRIFVLEVGSGAPVRLEPSSPNIVPLQGGVPLDSTPPEFTSPVVSFDQLLCEAVPGRPAAEERGCMTPFVLGSGPGELGMLSFVTPNGASVEAAMSGVVEAVTFTRHSDLTHADLFDVVLRPGPDSAFFLEYRDLKAVTVEPGDVVEAGQTLGESGDHFDPLVGSASFVVRREQELVQHLCPDRYAQPAVSQSWGDSLEASNEAFPTLAQPQLCSTPSIVCDPASSDCASADDFEAVQGDVDAGRRIYARACGGCHGWEGEGGIGPPVCVDCGCSDCASHEILAARTEDDMPPEGYCDPECAADVAAFILYAFRP